MPLSGRDSDTARTFALTKVMSGDYILPSNDTKTLWRIVAYEEDGSAEFVSPDGKIRHVIRGRHWQVMRYARPFSGAEHLPDDFLEWENWEHHAGTLSSRREAIQEALRTKMSHGA